MTHIDSNDQIDVEFDENDDEYVEEFADEISPEVRPPVEENPDVLHSTEVLESTNNQRRGSRRIMEDDEDGVEDDEDDDGDVDNDSDGDDAQVGHEWRDVRIRILFCIT